MRPSCSGSTVPAQSRHQSEQLPYVASAVEKLTGVCHFLHLILTAPSEKVFAGVYLRHFRPLPSVNPRPAAPFLPEALPKISTEGLIYVSPTTDQLKVV